MLDRFVVTGKYGVVINIEKFKVMKICGKHTIKICRITLEVFCELRLQQEGNEVTYRDGQDSIDQEKNPRIESRIAEEPDKL